MMVDNSLRHRFRQQQPSLRLHRKPSMILTPPQLFAYWWNRGQQHRMVVLTLRSLKVLASRHWALSA